MLSLGSLFARPRASAGSARDAGDDRWFEAHPRSTDIGVRVSVERARQVPVVRDCLQILSHSVAGLRFGVMRRTPGGRETADAHPVMRLLRAPSPRMTSFDLFAHMVDDLCAWGRFHAVLRTGARGELVGLERMAPERTAVEIVADGSLRFRETRRGQAQRVAVEDEVWHIAMPPMLDECTGRSPILHDGIEAVGVAIALQRYANALFTNDATPPYVWVMPDGQAFRSEDDKRNFLTAIAKWVTGRNRHRPAVTEYGIKPHRMGLTAEEAQFLDTRKELWLDLTRIWRVPPHKVGIMDRATFSNIEHQSLEFVMDTLRPILELIERSVDRFLIGDEDHHFEFDVSSLLRGDIASRYSAYAVGRQWGWLSVNDVLEMENRNGIGPAGDRYVEPLNMVPVGTGAGGRDRESRAGIDRAIAFLHESVGTRGARTPRLEVVRDAA